MTSQIIFTSCLPQLSLIHTQKLLGITNANALVETSRAPCTCMGLRYLTVFPWPSFRSSNDFQTSLLGGMAEGE